MFDVLAAGVHTLPLAAATTSGLTDWIKSNIFPLACFFVAALIMFRAHAKDMAGALVTLAVVLLGLGVAAMGTGNNGIGIGTWVLSLIWHH